MNARGRVTVDLTLNGREVSETLPAGTLLSEFLRRSRNLTGTHRGCESGKCGACTVLLDGDPVKSCNVLAAQAHERELTTIEGLSEAGELHPVQESFWEHHGMQCGYCTPGFVVNAAALLDENADPTEAEIREHLAGNICRCTGYTKIFESVQAAADREGEER